MDKNILHLSEDDVPGAKLKYNTIDQHSVAELKRWLECRSLKKTGKKADLIQRVINCINAGRSNNIDVSIDKGKWLEVLHNHDNNYLAEECKKKPTEISAGKWDTFPSKNIPIMFNKGHIYYYIVESIHDCSTTEKPFRRGQQYCDSGYVNNLADCIAKESYIVKCKVKASFKQIFYDVIVQISLKSGSIKKGTCNCKQSALGRCSHVAALLLTIWKHIEENGYSAMQCTSKLCQWNMGSKRKHPMAVTAVNYSSKRQRLKKNSFDPRSTTTFNESHLSKIERMNNFINDISVVQAAPCLWLSSLKITYEDFKCDTQDLNILSQQCQIFNNTLKDLANKLINTLSYHVIHNTVGQTDNLNWFSKRSLFITSSVAKRVLGLKNEESTKNFLKSHMWSLNIFDSFATTYGKNYEGNARNDYLKCITVFDKNATVDTTGLCINKLNPQLGCSPDGIVTIAGEKGLLEIKCPALLNNKYIWNFDKILNNTQLQSQCLLKNEDGTLSLKKNHQYYYQVQLSLGILNFQWCDFVIWSQNSLVTLRIQFDKEFYYSISAKLIKFHHEILVPEYFLMKTPRDLPPINYK